MELIVQDMVDFSSLQVLMKTISLPADELENQYNISLKSLLRHDSTDEVRTFPRSARGLGTEQHGSKRNSYISVESIIFRWISEFGEPMLGFSIYTLSSVMLTGQKQRWSMSSDGLQVPAPVALKRPGSVEPIFRTCQIWGICPVLQKLLLRHLLSGKNVDKPEVTFVKFM